MRRAGLIVLGLYFLCLHLVLLGAILDPYHVSRAVRLVRGTSDTAWRPTEFWSEMVAVHKRVDASASGAVLLFGDSLVQGMDVSAVAIDAINYGIGGDEIEGLARRLPIYHSLPRAHAVVVEIGTNDLVRHDAAAAAADYQRLMVDISSTVPLILSAVLPVDERIRKCCSGFRNNSEIRKLNGGIEKICGTRLNCTFIDPRDALVDPAGNLRAEFHEADGLHLSPAGYRLWASLLREAVAKGASTRRQ